MPQIKRISSCEMMRIQGVYIYILNGFGQVGALLGFHTLTVNVVEDSNDELPVKGFMRVDRFIYPLERSYSPIFCWGPDRLILPDPFSEVEKPLYIIIRLPLRISREQKSTLFNLLDSFGHIRGQFTIPSAESLLLTEKKFILSQLTPFEENFLDKAEMASKMNKLAKAALVAKECPSQNDNSKQRNSLVPCPYREDNTQDELLANAELTQSLEVNEPLNIASKHQEKRLPNTAYLRGGHTEFYGRSLRFRENDDIYSNAGGLDKYVILPEHVGNLMRLYILGPRDPQHIQINQVKVFTTLPYLVYSALKDALHCLIKARATKEHLGIMPSFMPHTNLLRPGFGVAENLNLFGPCFPSPKTTAFDPKKGVRRPSFLRLVSLMVQNLQAAAALFDAAIKENKLELLSLERVQKSQVDLLPAMILAELVVRFHRTTRAFAHIHVLSYTLVNDIIYKNDGPYTKNLHEDCEHHYPKLRPRNLVTDPQFEYARLAPVYKITF